MNFHLIQVLIEIDMSQKQTKRVRKEIKRRVDKNMGDGIEALKDLVRERPRFIPKKIWALAYWPLFKGKYWKMVAKNING